MKIGIVVLICLVLFFVLMNCPKVDSFSPKLTTPKIIKVIKESSSAIVEWYHDNTDIEDYVLLYVDVEKLGSGVWVQNNVKCKTKRCRLVLKNLAGNRYKLAVLSRHKDKLSDLEPEDIITFSGDKPYEGLAVEDSGIQDLVAEGDNKPLPKAQKQKKAPSISNDDSKMNAPSITKEKGGEPSSSSPAPAPVEVPMLDCTGGFVKIQNIKTKEEVKTAKMEPKCGELEDLSEYMKKPFYHDMLDKIF